MKTCNRLRECGYHSIRMLEVRQRPFDGRKNLYETVDLGLEEQKIEGAATSSESIHTKSIDRNDHTNTESHIHPQDNGSSSDGISHNIKDIKVDCNENQIESSGDENIRHKKQKIDEVQFGSSSRKPREVFICLVTVCTEVYVYYV